MYLGESGGERSEFHEGGASTVGGGVNGSGQSLEQYISNAREALGVDSHYSRYRCDYLASRYLTKIVNIY